VDPDWARSSRGVNRRAAAWEQKMRRVGVIITRPVGGRVTRRHKERCQHGVHAVCEEENKIVSCDTFFCEQ